MDYRANQLRNASESGSIILTANKSYGEWVEVFSGAAVIAPAILDRLARHPTKISIKGESYRLKGRGRRPLRQLERSASMKPAPLSFPAA